MLHCSAIDLIKFNNNNREMLKQELLVDILDEFYCEDGEYKFADNVISDHKSYGLMTFSEIFALGSTMLDL